MPDYINHKEMYASLFGASGEALDILTAVRRKGDVHFFRIDKTAQAEKRAGE